MDISIVSFLKEFFFQQVTAADFCELLTTLEILRDKTLLSYLNITKPKIK
jgi:hypothetical protein